VASENLQDFVNNNDGEGEREDQPPFVHVQGGDREDLGQEGNVHDDEVESHGYGSSSE